MKGLWRKLARVFQRAERQTCPRRLLEFGPWLREEKLDYWERRRSGGKLRFCSFCGGLHPEDALGLVKTMDIRVIPTDKRYKLYLEGGDLFKYKRPIKVYIQHFSSLQICSLQTLLKRRRSEHDG
jgi:hypothetical protein